MYKVECLLLLVLFIVIASVLGCFYYVNNNRKWPPNHPSGYNSFHIVKRKDAKGFEIIARKSIKNKGRNDDNNPITYYTNSEKGFCKLTCPQEICFDDFEEAKAFYEMEYHVDYKKRPNKIYLRFDNDRFDRIYESGC